MSENYIQASLYAIKYEKLTGKSYEFFKVMALARKPKAANTFLSICDEVKALIENIWFDKDFRANRGTIQMLYDVLQRKCFENEVAFPSYPTVARYIDYLMKECNRE